MKSLNNSIKQNPDRWFNIAINGMVTTFALVVLLTIIFALKATWATKEVQKSQLEKLK